MLAFFRIPILTMTAWVLLASWLLFGGLVMAEQVFPEIEATQASDGYDPELEVLLSLEYAVQPATSALAKEAGPAVCPVLLEPVASIQSLPGRAPAPECSPPPKSGLALHKQLSTYRI